MKRFAAMLFVPLLAAGCGSSPGAATPTTASAPRGTSLQMTFVPDSDSVKGWPSPMSMTLRASEGDAPAVIHSATFRMLDDAGQVLAQSTVTIGDAIPQGVYLSGDVVVQTLSWPPDRGHGKRIDGSLVLRGASGDLRTVPLSIPAR